MSAVMMKCGCAAQGTCSSLRGIIYDPPVPSCLVHDCIEQAEPPNLAGRLAKCAYSDCRNTRESSLSLPFFEYLGPGSPETERKCKCGFYWIAHCPLWDVHIRVVRRWYKIERDDSITVKTFHAPEELKVQAAEQEAEFFRSQTRDKNTEVFSAEIVKLEPSRKPNRMKCKEFTPIGSQQYDKFYCGCKGWD